MACWSNTQPLILPNRDITAPVGGSKKVDKSMARVAPGLLLLLTGALRRRRSTRRFHSRYDTGVGRQRGTALVSSSRDPNKEFRG